MLKKLITLLALTSVFTVSAHATIRPAKPENCPSVATIQASGFQAFYQNADNANEWVGVSRPFNDETNTQWQFFEGFGKGSQDDAKAQLEQALTTIAYKKGPSSAPIVDGWYCEYSSNSDIVGIALTPSPIIDQAHLFKSLR